MEEAHGYVCGSMLVQRQTVAEKTARCWQDPLCDVIIIRGLCHAFDETYIWVGWPFCLAVWGIATRMRSSIIR